MDRRGVVLLTDRAWPDDEIERRIIEEAGFDLVVGPADPAPKETIEDLVKTHDPVAIMTCWAQVSSTAIQTPSRLGVVARMGVGLDNIDVAAATERGTLVTNVPDYCVEEVSDHALGLILDWTRGIARYDRDVRAGRWDPAGARLQRLRSKTIGIVGYGRIGRATARKCAALGCRVIVHDPVVDPSADVEFVSWPELLGVADAVVLHVPLTPATRHLVGAPELAAMRDGALLVNVSRGGLVDTAALVVALDAGRIAGAALDVLEEEPTVDPALLAHPNAVITPHVAFSSDESVEELRTKAAQEVVRVLRGQQPHYPCNTPTVRPATEERVR
ncbi:C-terminal binding protein [Streptomyces canus]|uniref:C-terminal binding protein n=1 Tax=Streptomyces TaxID=1883 RepID=UPI000851AF1E|nr:C-terminal binding protein [Streptomyces sp. LUP47B]